VGCLILIVQHGEKEWQPGDPGLTDLGRNQARRTAQWLLSTHAVDRIVTSPLRRAVETAEPIARLLSLDVTMDARLRERMNWEGEHEQTLEAFLAEWRRASADRSFVPRSGDSSEQAAERFVAALDDLAATAGDDGQVVVVAHGGVTVDALRTLLGDERLLAQRPSLIDAGVPCGAVTTLRWVASRWVVDLPSTAHLDHQIDHRQP
jgi:broad specificity phosphatase PhoE